MPCLTLILCWLLMMFTSSSEVLNIKSSTPWGIRSYRTFSYLCTRVRLGLRNLVCAINSLCTHSLGYLIPSGWEHQQVPASSCSVRSWLVKVIKPNTPLSHRLSHIYATKVILASSLPPPPTPVAPFILRKSHILCTQASTLEFSLAWLVGSE